MINCQPMPPLQDGTTQVNSPQFIVAPYHQIHPQVVINLLLPKCLFACAAKGQSARGGSVFLPPFCFNRPQNAASRGVGQLFLPSIVPVLPTKSGLSSWLGTSGGNCWPVSPNPLPGFGCLKSCCPAAVNAWTARFL